MKLPRYSHALVVGGALVAVLASGVAAARPERSAPPRRITVYKSPSCGCCKKWIDHLEAQGFAVTAVDTADMQSVKRTLGVPSALGSCHTAVVEGYLVEGHVPADLIQRLVTERPTTRGIAVPGMPIGSPGMEGPYREHYDVVAFDKQGKTSVYARR
jgi:hypothetical protein